MIKLVRLFAVVTLVVIGSFVALVVNQRKAEMARTPTREQVFHAEDQRLIDTLANHSLGELQVQAVPSYTDLTREIQKGVLAYVRARSRMNEVLTSNYDLLQRYAPADVPAVHRKGYLAQNAAWMKTVAQGTNDQIRALKNFQGDIHAFFISHPEDQQRFGAAVDQGIGDALKRLKPGAKLIKALAAARHEAARKPSIVSVGRYDRSQAAFDRWHEQI